MASGSLGAARHVNSQLPTSNSQTELPTWDRENVWPKAESPQPRAVIRQLPRRTLDWSQRPTPGRTLRRRLQHAFRDQPACAATFLCDAPAAGRRRPARDPGAARARTAVDDAALHARERGAVARGLSKSAPAREERVGVRRARSWGSAVVA